MKSAEQWKTVEFIEQDEDFVRRISGDVGCYYRKTNKYTYNLSTSDNAIPGKMGVFAWVHKAEKDYFWVATRKQWLDEVRDVSIGSHFTQNTLDGDCISFDTRDSYQDTVRALKLIYKKR